jgi:hypothetical protein
MPQTVFILGAGASHEVNLPTGAGLTTTIASMLDIRFDRRSGGPAPVSGDLRIVEALRHRFGDINPHIHAARRINEGMPIASSIDTFLDAHRADERIELCGKLAIVRAILEAECNSGLYRDLTQPHIPLSLDRVRASWFKWFWRLLCDDCTADQLAERARSVSFVVFNYDRCVEQFLYYAARAYYGMPDNAAAAAVSNIRMFHPYGSIGPLPWQDPSGAVDFGSTDIGAPLLLELAARIKTFAESTGPGDEEVEALRLALNAADRMVFLGFAYHRQNMRLMWPENAPKHNARVFGTSKGFSNSDAELISIDILNMAGILGPIVLRDLTCNDLFHEYSRSLSLV